LISSEVQLICGRKLPILAAASVQNDHTQIPPGASDYLPTCKGRLNYHEVAVLRDTGCSLAVVKSSLVLPEQLTGEVEACALIDGTVKKYPTATVDIQSEFYNGSVKALVMLSALYDVIIGNIPDETLPKVKLDGECRGNPAE
jgi:hypothetical protein